MAGRRDVFLAGSGVKPRGATDILYLALHFEGQISAVDGINGKLDARRAGIEYQQAVAHGPPSMLFDILLEPQTALRSTIALSGRHNDAHRGPLNHEARNMRAQRPVATQRRLPGASAITRI